MMVLLGVLVLLVLLLLLPVGLKAQYDRGGGKLVAYLGPVSQTLYPATTKQKKSQKDGEKTPAEHPKNELGGTVPLFRELLEPGLEALSCLRRRLCLKELTFYVTVGAKGKDPSHWGIIYGGAWAGVGNLIPLLENVFQIQTRDIQVRLDEETQDSCVVFSGQFRLFLGEILYLLLRYGLTGLKICSKWKGSNEHGTSDQ